MADFDDQFLPCDEPPVVYTDPAADIREMWQDAFQLAEAEWRRATLEVLKAALRAFDDDPRAPMAVPRLLAAARLAVS